MVPFAQRKTHFLCFVRCADFWLRWCSLLPAPRLLCPPPRWIPKACELVDESGPTCGSVRLLDFCKFKAFVASLHVGPTRHRSLESICAKRLSGVVGRISITIPTWNNNNTGACSNFLCVHAIPAFCARAQLAVLAIRCVFG